VTRARIRVFQVDDDLVTTSFHPRLLACEPDCALGALASRNRSAPIVPAGLELIESLTGASGLAL
jgi:hypothetical protein